LRRLRRANMTSTTTTASNTAPTAAAGAATGTMEELDEPSDEPTGTSDTFCDVEVGSSDVPVAGGVVPSDATGDCELVVAPPAAGAAVSVAGADVWPAGMTMLVVVLVAVVGVVVTVTVVMGVCVVVVVVVVVELLADVWIVGVVDV
jgi:hypothetical protein